MIIVTIIIIIIGLFFGFFIFSFAIFFGFICLFQRKISIYMKIKMIAYIKDVLYNEIRVVSD